jgi:hypothetical protein
MVITYEVLIWKQEKKKQHGTPRHKDTIKIDFELKWEVSNQMQVAQGGE